MLNVDPAQKAKVNEDVKAEAAANVAKEEVALGNPEDYGVDSDTIALVGYLDNPAEDDTWGDKKVFKIVGYRFKSKKDIVIPDCGLDEGVKKDLMNFVNIEGTKKVKAGEEFDLTFFETALLLSRKEYNGKATGGDVQVGVRYQTKANKRKDGTVAKVNEIPRASLSGLNKSIRESKGFSVLECKRIKNEKGQTRKVRTMNKGFEKFAPLAAKTVRAQRTSTAAETNGINKNAALFLARVKAYSKKANK